MGLSFDIKSFNFITWDWGADVSLEEAKKEIDYQILNCNINAVTFAFATRSLLFNNNKLDWKPYAM